MQSSGQLNIFPIILSVIISRRTDHKPLLYYDNLKLKSRRLISYIERLSQYSFTLHYIQERSYIVADTLSRATNAIQLRSVANIDIREAQKSDATLARFILTIKSNESFVDSTFGIHHERLAVKEGLLID